MQHLIGMVTSLCTFAVDAGVQGVKGMEGELWGIDNLLKLTADRVEAQNIVAAQRQSEEGFRIEPCNVSQLGARNQ